MKLLNQYKGQFLFTFILCIAILIMPFQDRLDRTLTASDFNIPEEYSKNAYIHEATDGIIVTDGSPALALTSDPFYFKKGTYEVSFMIQAEQEGCSVEIWEPLVVNPNNTTGNLLAAAPIPVSGEPVRISFTVEDFAERIQFHINCPASLFFNCAELLSEPGLYRDPLIYAGILLLGSALLLWYRCHRKVRMKILFLLAFAAIWSSMPLSYTWLFDGHDLYFHYGRLFNLAESLLEGQFPVRIHSNLYQGMTYLSPIFYPEFFLYPFVIPAYLGMSPIGCYKLLLFAINATTAGVSYYAFSRLTKSRKIGTIAAFLYTLSMFRLINLFTRAAVGELLATIFLPLLLLGMYQLFIGDSQKWITATLAFTALFQSHLISTFLAVGFGVLFALCFLKNLKDQKRLLHLILAGGSTFLLNLWFAVPLLDHMRYSVYTLNDTRKLAGYSLFAAQFFDVGVNNPAAFAEGPNTYTPEMPYSLGIILLIGILLFVFSAFRKNNRHFSMGKYCLAMGALAMYAASSFFPWDFIQRFGVFNKLAGTIQFASRFLPFSVVFLCLVSAIGIYYFFDTKDMKQMLFLCCAVLTVYSAGTYFSNYIEQAAPFVTKETQMDHSHDTDFLYFFDNQGEYFSYRKIASQSIAFEAPEGIILTNCYREDTNAGFTYTKSAENTEAYVDVSFNNYPNFHAYDSQGNRLTTGLNEMLRLRVFLPEAESDTISIRFVLPKLYRLCDLISLVTAVFLVVAVSAERRKKYLFPTENTSEKENLHGH